jgi:hypothetical protein
MRKQTYAISFTEARREYLKNEALRELLNSGCFVYAEESYVLNDERYITQRESNYFLTDYARTHLDECALLFEEREIIKYSGTVTRGEAAPDAVIGVRMATTFAPKRQTNTLTDEIKRLRESFKLHFDIQATNQKSCWERIYEIATSNGSTTSGMFKQKTGLIPKYFDRAKKNDPSMPEMRAIITIAAAYDLDLTTTEELLKLAGHSFSPTSKEHDCFRFIITTMYGYTMQAKNELLDEEGFDPLGSKPQNKERKL